MILTYTGMEKFTYAKAGVNIDIEDSVVKNILQTISFTVDSVVVNGLRLVLCTDGVGSKVLVANAMKKWDTIGIDCIAMNVNDALVMGARPIAFVDYIAMECIDEKMAVEIAKGLKKGADEAGVIITGGETATLSEIIHGFDLAGTCLGVVEHPLPKPMHPGDVIIGMRSSGIHSNGYTLARKIFTKNGYSFHDEIDEIGVIGHALLEPTKIYVKEILELWNAVPVKGIAHITGSGLRKLARLSKNICFSLKKPLEPQPIFQIMQCLGAVSMREMYLTFNMGMGMAVIVAPSDADEALALLNKYSESHIVGTITKGKGVSIPSIKLHV